MSTPPSPTPKSRRHTTANIMMNSVDQSILHREYGHTPIAAMAGTGKAWPSARKKKTPVKNALQSTPERTLLDFPVTPPQAGYVVPPDGGKPLWVGDKEFFFKQWPEARTSTGKAAEALWAVRDQVKEREERKSKKVERGNGQCGGGGWDEGVEWVPQQGEVKGHWTPKGPEVMGKDEKRVADAMLHPGCVGGRIASSCGECAGGFASVKAGNGPCEKCDGVGVSFVPCEKCVKDEREKQERKEAQEKRKKNMEKREKNKREAQEAWEDAQGDYDSMPSPDPV